MKTILTMPSPELALLTMTGEGKPFVLNRRTMAELEALLDEVRRMRGGLRPDLGSPARENLLDAFFPDFCFSGQKRPICESLRQSAGFPRVA